MNLLDAFLVLGTLMSMAAGFTLGFVTRVASWAGVIGGVLTATWVVPPVLRTFGTDDPLSRLVVTLAVYVILAGVGGSVGEAVGHVIRRRIPAPGRRLDRAGGAVAGAAGFLAIVWLLAPIAAEVPGPVARQVRASAITQWVHDVAPPPPGQIRTLSNLVAQTGFPEVFAGLGPSPEVGAPPEQLPLAAAALDQVVASSAAVESVGCGVLHEGSGFVVEPGVIATNAHVVAGAEQVTVKPAGGDPLDATVVVFDDDRDLALLQVPGLQVGPLPIASADAGTQGAVVGYPRGQDQPRPVPMAIDAIRDAVGRDIYGQDQVRRLVQFLAANLDRGDSGSPVVDPQGQVVGVSFAIAPDRPGLAYALDDSELRAVLEQPRNQSPGPCV